MSERTLSLHPGNALLGAMVSGLWYVAVSLMIWKNDTVVSPFLIGSMHIGFIFLTVGIAQYRLKRKAGENPGFKRLWLYGWMSALLLGLIIALFYRVFFAQTGEAPNIPNYFARMLITYNFFGLVISAIVSFFISGKFRRI